MVLFLIQPEFQNMLKGENKNKVWLYTEKFDHSIFLTGIPESLSWADHSVLSAPFLAYSAELLLPLLFKQSVKQFRSRCQSHVNTKTLCFTPAENITCTRSPTDVNDKAEDTSCCSQVEVYAVKPQCSVFSRHQHKILLLALIKTSKRGK